MKEFSLPTLGMALLLSFVTWAYLYVQGTDQNTIKVSFEPVLDVPDLVSGTFRMNGATLKSKDLIEISVSGPKGDFVTLQSRAWTCTPRIDPADLQEQGSIQVPLDRTVFNFPATFTIVNAPRITLDYEMYTPTDITLHVPDPAHEGTPGGGLRVKSVTPVPTRIKAKIPASLRETMKALILPVPVEGRIDLAFSIDDWKLDEGAAQARILPLEKFRVDVQLSQDVSSKRMTLDLNVSAPPGQGNRIRLEDKTLTIGLAGPKDLVDQAAGRPNAFHAFIVVTPGDLDTTGPKNIREINCVITEPLYRDGGVTAIIMPDTAPENREVKITVLDGPK